MKKYIMIFLVIAFVTCKQKTSSTPIPKSFSEKKYHQELTGLPIDSFSIKKYNNTLLLTFYKMNGFKTVWNKPEIRAKMLEAISTSDEQGLLPKDYDIGRLKNSESKIGEMTEKDFILYDIRLTLSAQKYLSDVTRGKLSPKTIYTNWDLPADETDINMMISGGISGDSIGRVIKKSEPQHLVYKRLKIALQIINELPKDNLKTIDIGGKKLVRNDTSSAMVNIKKRLIYWNDMKPQDTLTKIYDRRTFKAVKRFQLRHGLSADGVIGKGTVAALNFTKLERKQQIIANLERWRWFPRDMGDQYIIINIPGYQMYVVKDNDTIEERRIVVGKSERKTPVLTSTFSNIIFNPTWTVPPTIIKEDLTPDAIRDRNYFVKRNIIIYDYKGNAISPENWNPRKAKSYRYVQCPGDDNALGIVKFNFPNHFTVYLHDTNHRNFFGINKRSLSSGCVRVENPLPLAEYMLDDEENWPMKKILEVIASRETTTVPLKQKIRIHQLYWTAWSEDSTLIFRDDIYNLDYALYALLRK